MNRVVQSILRYTCAAINRLGSFFHLSAVRLLWGFGAVVFLLPAAAYAWRLYNPSLLFQRTEDQGAQNTILKQNTILNTERPAPEESDDAKLHAATEDASVPSPDNIARSQTADGKIKAELHINGQEVALPPQGTVHKEISSQNGKTSVDISVKSGTSGSSRSYSSTSMDINLDSRTESDNTDVSEFSYD